MQVCMQICHGEKNTPSKSKMSSCTPMLGLQLYDSDGKVRELNTLSRLEPATIAQDANARVAMLEDSSWRVRNKALAMLGKLEPTTLALHASAVVSRLEDSRESVRAKALTTLGKLDPATLAQHAFAVVMRLKDSDGAVRQMAYHTLEMLPRYVRYTTLGVDCKELLSRALDHNENEAEELRS